MSLPGRPKGEFRSAQHEGFAVNDLVPQARLTAALWECDRHCAALRDALQDWHSRATPDAQALDSDSSLRRLTDQILYRFAKLQDAMGERLIPATLGWLREAHEAWPMRDRLDRLEKLGFLDVKAMLNKSLRVWAPWFGMGCKAQTTAIAQLWRGFATPQTAQNRDDRAARDLFSVALTPGCIGATCASGWRMSIRIKSS